MIFDSSSLKWLNYRQLQWNVQMRCQFVKRSEFGAYIALIQISDRSEIIWSSATMIFGSSSLKWLIYRQLQWNVQIRCVLVNAH